MRKRNHYARLSITFSEPANNSCKRNISLKMAEQLSAEYFTKFVDSLKSTIERDFRLSRIVHVGLEICARKL